MTFILCMYTEPDLKFQGPKANNIKEPISKRYVRL